MAMKAALGRLEAMGFPYQQARRAYRLVPMETKTGGSRATVVACAAELMISGAVPKEDGDDAPKPKSRATPRPPQPKSKARRRALEKAAVAKKRTHVGLQPVVATHLEPSTTTTAAPSLPVNQRAKPGHWPFENVERLKQAIHVYHSSGQVGVDALPGRFMISVGPKQQEWLSAKRVGTFGDLKKLSDAMATDLGSTPAQVAKLKAIREKVRVADMTLSV
eukprot:COSAG02_NODE_3008_length_7563_cov_3.445606_8_plen_220_part_00